VPHWLHAFRNLTTLHESQPPIEGTTWRQAGDFIADVRLAASSSGPR